VTPVGLIQATMSPWFEVASSTATQVFGRVTISIPGAASDVFHDLCITGTARAVEVREAQVGAILPAFCPERHINPGGSFCLGLNAGKVADIGGAEAWWQFLCRFLELQRVASRTGRWPEAQSLDHGDAGEHHAAALATARDLGIMSEYEAARAGSASWINTMRVREQGGVFRLLNGRARCPLGCQHKTGHPRLRRSCSHTDVVASLVYHERERDKKLREFWRSCRSRGAVCCGTMRKCPLGAKRKEEL
jgi:hypothetical protein